MKFFLKYFKKPSKYSSEPILIYSKGDKIYIASLNQTSPLEELPHIATIEISPPRTFSRSSIIRRIEVSPSGILAFKMGGYVFLRNLRDLENPQEIARFSDNVLDLKLYRDFIVYSNGKKIIFRDLLLDIVSSIEKPHIRNIDFSQDGKLATLSIDHINNEIVLRDISDIRHPKMLSVIDASKIEKDNTSRGFDCCVALSPNGKILTTLVRKKRRRCLYVRSLEEPEEPKLLYRKRIKVLSGNILVTNDLVIIGELAEKYSYVRIYNAKSGRILSKIQVEECLSPRFEDCYIKRILLSSDKKLLVVLSVKGIKILDISNIRKPKLAKAIYSGHIGSIALYYDDEPPQEVLFKLELSDKPTRIRPLEAYERLSALLEGFPTVPVTVLEKASELGLLKKLVPLLVEEGLIEEKDEGYYVKPPAEKIIGEVIERKSL